jgi:hypothetical protein
VLQGRFVELTSESISIEIVTSPFETPGASSQCTVIYSAGGRTNIFVSPVLEFQQGPDHLPRLVLSIPDRIVVGEARNSFRIPLHPQTDLHVRIRSESGTWHPRPKDVSLGGILVDFSEETEPDLPENTPVTVELGLQNQTAELEGFVGRCQGTLYAVYFAEALRELRSGWAEVPSVLRSIVDGLEREWLARKSS